MWYGKVVVVLLVLGLLGGGCSLATDRGSGTGGDAESTRVAMEATLAAMESTVTAIAPTQPPMPTAQPAMAPTLPAVSPTQAAAPPSPTSQAVVPTPRATPKTGPTDEETARKQLLEEQFAQSPRYPAEQVYFNNAVIFVYRVPNDLTDLGIFLGYKVTPEQRDALFSYPYYSTSKEIEGELFRWIWREGAVDYLKSQGAKPYWSEP